MSLKREQLSNRHMFAIMNKPGKARWFKKQRNRWIRRQPGKPLTNKYKGWWD